MKRITEVWLKSRGISEEDWKHFLCFPEADCEGVKIDVSTMEDIFDYGEGRWFLKYLPEPHRSRAANAWKTSYEHYLQVLCDELKQIEDDSVRCLYCGRPKATEDDRTKYSKDGDTLSCWGAHLCWDTPCSRVTPEEAVAKLHAYIEQCNKSNCLPTATEKNRALMGL